MKLKKMCDDDDKDFDNMEDDVKKLQKIHQEKEAYVNNENNQLHEQLNHEENQQENQDEQEWGSEKISY